ncbi:MAG TPA: hypothetical protein VK789_30140 [Bryobacteraceae bacterium]|nr:hypothetical protein [Bryobacteraceae bacterium]
MWKSPAIRFIPEALAIHAAGLMRPLFARSRTDAAATIFPQRGPFGLAEGTRADFLILDANPLAISTRSPESIDA